MARVPRRAGWRRRHLAGRRTARPGRPDRHRQTRLLRGPARGPRRSGQQHHGHPFGRAGHQIRPDRLHGRPLPASTRFL